jgi:hypothetical protein
MVRPRREGFGAATNRDQHFAWSVGRNRNGHSADDSDDVPGLSRHVRPPLLALRRIALPVNPTVPSACGWRHRSIGKDSVDRQRRPAASAWGVTPQGTVRYTAYEPAVPVHSSASPQDVREALIVAWPLPTTWYVTDTVPQPPPGMQGRACATAGGPTCWRTAAFEGGENVQKVLARTTWIVEPLETAMVRPSLASVSCTGLGSVITRVVGVGVGVGEVNEDVIDDVVPELEVDVGPDVVGAPMVLGGLEVVVEPVVVTVMALEWGAAAGPHPARSQMGRAKTHETITTRLITLASTLPAARLRPGSNARSGRRSGSNLRHGGFGRGDSFRRLDQLGPFRQFLPGMATPPRAGGSQLTVDEGEDAPAGNTST